jgi:hypothetical protein
VTAESDRAKVESAAEVPPAVRVLDITHTAFVTSRALHVMAKLGIADLLKDGARSSEELAAATRNAFEASLPSSAGAGECRCPD